jgi:hypothetical protein
MDTVQELSKPLYSYYPINSLEELRKTTNFRQDSWCPDWNSNREPIEYNCGALLLHQPARWARSLIPGKSTHSTVSRLYLQTEGGSSMFFRNIGIPPRK